MIASIGSVSADHFIILQIRGYLKIHDSVSKSFSSI